MKIDTNKVRSDILSAIENELKGTIISEKNPPSAVQILIYYPGGTVRLSVPMEKIKKQ